MTAVDEEILLAAYDDREGVTADFNLNILRRLNRELALVSIRPGSGIVFDGTAVTRESRCTFLRVCANNMYGSRQRNSMSISPRAKLFTPRTAISSRRIRLAPYSMMRALGDTERMSKARWVVCSYARGPSVGAVNQKSEAQRGGAATKQKCAAYDIRHLNRHSLCPSRAMQRFRK